MVFHPISLPYTLANASLGYFGGALTSLNAWYRDPLVPPPGLIGQSRRYRLRQSPAASPLVSLPGDLDHSPLLAGLLHHGRAQAQRRELVGAPGTPALAKSGAA